MADSTLVTQEEMALRRRARRRLVGAVAFALAAVVVLPMVFDPEPKPLGPEVDLRIPAKDSPFEPAPAAPATQPAANDPAPQVAEPTLPVPAQPAAAPVEAKPAAPDAVEAKPAEKHQDKPTDQTPAKEVPKTVEPKAETKKAVEAPKPVVKPEAKPAAKPEPAPAGKNYVLQLGAFGREINAKQLQDKVQAAGFKAQVSAAGGQFRVRVGPIADHDKALDFQAQLKAKGFNPVLLSL